MHGLRQDILWNPDRQLILHHKLRCLIPPVGLLEALRCNGSGHVDLRMTVGSQAKEWVGDMTGGLVFLIA
jgi:hypothetical protein